MFDDLGILAHLREKAVNASYTLGAGWMQMIFDFDDSHAEFDLLRRVAQRSGRPMSITFLQRDKNPEWWREVMGQIGQANRDGTKIVGQVLTRPIGVLLGFEISQTPFLGRPSWREIAVLPHAHSWCTSRTLSSFLR